MTNKIIEIPNPFDPLRVGPEQSRRTKRKRHIAGVVVSDKMAKTVVVEVGRTRIHPKYKKQYRLSRRFKAHDEKNEYKVGDRVIIEETRPLSKEKRWRVIGKA